MKFQVTLEGHPVQSDPHSLSENTRRFCDEVGGVTGFNIVVNDNGF